MEAEWSSLPQMSAKYLFIQQEREIVTVPFVEIVLGKNLTKDRLGQLGFQGLFWLCLLYTSDAADDWLVV